MLEFVRHSQAVVYLFYPASKRLVIHRQLSQCLDGSIESFDVMYKTHGSGASQIQTRLTVQRGDLSSLQVEKTMITLTLPEASIQMWMNGLATESNMYRDSEVPAVFIGTSSLARVEWVMLSRRSSI
ncbi:hypothetical protein EVJ33_04875 [Exiguobacterium sp. SL-10]|uniref:hypothetical protein n=1 Tax=unclassified Exiguobacterium TaxID=2644629 RepID=UPI00103DBEB2|nr:MULTISPECIES: hypothetical protein [unclassified Exiguobacterium]TCI22953.1 hypothetical protein EVJ34_00620 [Exiguobacterium sp. SL-9]TCI30635.1 hypothetical protein EVJ33_04875 [Exiguobacterium sp. SL-10]